MTSDPPCLYRLLMMLRARGGALVRAEDCTAEQRETARKHGQFVEDGDGDGHGWVLLGRTKT